MQQTAPQRLRASGNFVDLPTALRYARERVDDAIKVVVANRQAGSIASAAAGEHHTVPHSFSIALLASFPFKFGRAPSG
jgi:hypothetical protein